MGVYDNDVWEKLSDDKSKDFISMVNPHFEPIELDAQTSQVKRQDLSFYDEYKIYEVNDFDAIPNLTKYVLFNESAPSTSQHKIIPITWTNEPIYNLNQIAPAIINEETVTEYVKFFFNYVRGRHGRFLLVEHVDDINWKETPPPSARKAISELVEPIKIISKDENYNIKLSCNMVFKDSLFKSNVLVDSEGKVSLHDEEILVEGMPILMENMN